jgi:hypothetical protein
VAVPAPKVVKKHWSLTIIFCFSPKECHSVDMNLYNFKEANYILIVGFEVHTAVVMKSSVLWDETPCGPLKGNQCFRGICLLHLQGRRISQAKNRLEAGSKQNVLFATCFTLLSCMAYSLTLKMEEICSSETSVDFQWTTQRYIPEGRTLNVLIS